MARRDNDRSQVWTLLKIRPLGPGARQPTTGSHAHQHRRRYAPTQGGAYQWQSGSWPRILQAVPPPIPTGCASLRKGGGFSSRAAISRTIPTPTPALTPIPTPNPTSSGFWPRTLLLFLLPSQRVVHPRTVEEVFPAAPPPPEQLRFRLRPRR